MTLKGIDISSWQGGIDFDKVKADGIQFAIIRCGYGNNLLSQDDTFFSTNVRGCERAAIPWGVYIYSYARNLAEAESEAEHVLRLLKGKKPSYPIYIDMEDADGYKAREKVSNIVCSEICDLFCRKIREAGFYPGIYANRNWLENKLDYKLVSKWDIWLAEWGKEPTFSRPFKMWQYTSGGSVSGISGRVDMNLCYVDYPAIIKSQGLNGWDSGGGSGSSAGGGGNNASGIKVGDRVKYSGRLYKDSYGGGIGRSVDGEFIVSRIIHERKFGVLLNDGLGWVSGAECRLVEKPKSADNKLKVGDSVRVRGGVRSFYDGVACASFVLTSLLYVREVREDRILVSTLKSGSVTGWFKPNDLIKAVS